MFGIGVLVVNRRRARARRSAPRRRRRAPRRPRRPKRRRGTDGGARARGRCEPEVVEPEVVEPEVVAPPAPVTLRERMARARSALAGRVRRRARPVRHHRRDVGRPRGGRCCSPTSASASPPSCSTTCGCGSRTRRSPSPTQLLDALRDDMKGQLDGADRALHFEPADDGSPNVWLFVGVNGVGKTTTIGKVGHQQIAAGRTRADGRRRHVPRRRRRAARHVGRAGRRRARARQRGRRPRRRRVRRRRAGDRPRHRPRARRHRRAPAHQDEPDGGAAQGPPGRREGRRPGHRGAPRHRRHDRARTASPRPASSATPRRSRASC